VVPISGQDLSRHDKIVKVACKNHDNCASVGSPIDFVSVAGLARYLNLNKWLKIDLVDFLMHYEFVWAAEGN